MKSNFEKFKNKKQKQNYYDKPKKHRKQNIELDELDYQKLLESGYSTEEIIQHDLDN